MDNEYLCLALARELGLAVPEAEIVATPRIRALAVTRFDRRWAQEGRVLLRLPQEDLCQAFGLPSAMKYESDGGPGIAAIMTFLLGSSEALKDRYDFMKFMVFQWLTGATDGHAKNFSIYLLPGGSYRLTPFYDITFGVSGAGRHGTASARSEAVDGAQCHKGRKTEINAIYPRHFLATAKAVNFPRSRCWRSSRSLPGMCLQAIESARRTLPADFPATSGRPLQREHAEAARPPAARAQAL